MVRTLMPTGGSRVSWYVGGILTILASMLLACDASSDRTARATPHPTVTITTSEPTPDSPRPTAVPAVSATPVLPLQAYFGQVLPVIEAYVQATDAALTLAESPRPDDAGWRAQFQATIDPLRTADRTVQRVSPPPCLDPAHKELRRAMETARRASDVIAAVVMTHTVDELGVVQQLLQTSLDDVAAATRALRAADC